MLPFPLSMHFPLHLPRLHRSSINCLGTLVFTIGCMVLVTNAILSFLPYAGSDFHTDAKVVYLEGALSIASNIFFLLGSFCAFVQILNAKRAELYDESKSKMAVSEEDMGLKAEKPPQPNIEIFSVSPEHPGSPLHPYDETLSEISEHSETPPPSYAERASGSRENFETPPPSYRERSSVVSVNFETPPPSYREMASVSQTNPIIGDDSDAREFTRPASCQTPTPPSDDPTGFENDVVFDKTNWLHAEKLGVNFGIYPPTAPSSETASVSSQDSTSGRSEAASESNTRLAEEPAPQTEICVMRPVTSSEMDPVSSDGPTLANNDAGTTDEAPEVSSVDFSTLVRDDCVSDGNTWLSVETRAPVMGIYAMTPACSTENLTAGFQVDNGKDLESQSEAPYTTIPDDLCRYIPSRHEMWVRSIHEIGFRATAIFFGSSLLYCATSIASLITIARTGHISRWVRYPQLVAAVGFAIASIILMIQAQQKWWRPALHRLRWYINFLNLIGSAGFIFCACFGLVENVYWARYQFGMSYLWGSWAFLFGSSIQCYKFVNRRKQAAAQKKEWKDKDYDRDKDLML